MFLSPFLSFLGMDIKIHQPSLMLPEWTRQQQMNFCKKDKQFLHQVQASIVQYYTLNTATEITL